MTLYEINEKIRAFLENNIDTETGEILNLDTLGDLELERSVKLENYALAVKNIRADIEAIKAEEDALKARRERLSNTKNRLEAVLKQELDGEKFTTARVQITHRKTNSVEVLDITALPEKFLRYKPAEADKTAIKAAINAGETVDGARLVNGLSMTIK